MKNWKTTLFGALSAVSLALAPLIPSLTAVLTPLAAVFLALATFFAKDSNVTGGSVQQ